jgi:hypothetical protein
MKGAVWVEGEGKDIFEACLMLTTPLGTLRHGLVMIIGGLEDLEMMVEW